MNIEALNYAETYVAQGVVALYNCQLVEAVTGYEVALSIAADGQVPALCDQLALYLAYYRHNILGGELKAVL